MYKIDEIRNTIIQGNTLDVLKDFPDMSVQMVVTSPPYWGLRDYGITGQLGLEKSPEEYVYHLVEIFREVKRVLRDDGTVWLNLGDSYASQGGPEPTQSINSARVGGSDTLSGGKSRKTIGGLKPKDLVGIPWMVAFAFALRSDGWYLRSDIIWQKNNPMPESIKDRPTKSYEHIFLLSKSQHYYYDSFAISEPAIYAGDNRGTRTDSRRGTKMNSMSGVTGAIRNARDVWSINTKPYKEAHFAVFPPELPKRCILAGTSEKGCCPKCGKPYKRVIEVPKPPQEVFTNTKKPKDGFVSVNVSGKGEGQKYQNWRNEHPVKTVDWKSTCSCGAVDSIPCIVMDIFMGSGTTAKVAKELGRDYVGIELKPEYIELANKRLS